MNGNEWEPMVTSGNLMAKQWEILRGTSLTEKNYWADNSYYSDLEVTIYGQ